MLWLILWKCFGYSFNRDVKMFKNVSKHLKINEIHEKYLSNIVECIDDKMEILYNCNGECRQ